MTTTTVRPPKPRRRAAPSRRNQQIYLDYQTTGRSQNELAEEYHLTQCRISQIIKRVEKWLAEGEPAQCPKSEVLSQDDSAATLDLGLGTLNSALQRSYLAFVCREAIRQFHADRVTVTTKKGTRGDKPIDETTERREPKSLQCLNIVLRAVNTTAALSREQTRSRSTANKPSTGNAPGASSLPANSYPTGSCRPDDPDCIDASTDEMRRQKVESWICTNRATRKRQPDGNIDLDCLEAEDLVSAIIGEPHNGEVLEKIANDIGKTLAPLGWDKVVGDKAVGWDKASSEAAGPPAEQTPTRHSPPTPINTTCAIPPKAPQPPSAKPLATKPIKQEVHIRPKMDPQLIPLYDKVRQQQLCQRSGLPQSFYFTEEELQQMHRLPSIYLEPVES